MVDGSTFAEGEALLEIVLYVSFNVLPRVNRLWTSWCVNLNMKDWPSFWIFDGPVDSALLSFLCFSDNNAMNLLLGDFILS
jgi:hypothetical protein